MQEYMDNGCQLGWLLNIQDKEVEIYQQNKEVQVRSINIENKQSLAISGDFVLPGFILDLTDIL